MKKVNIVIGVALPIFLLILLRTILIYSNRIIGPLARLEKQLDKAIKLDIAGDRRGAMKALGQGLHAIQDAWSHDLRTPQGTMTEHLRPTQGDPDDPDQNPFWWNLSRKATAEYIKDFTRARGLKPLCD